MRMVGEIVLPARHGCALRLAAGDAVEVETPQGSQVVDTWAFAAADLTEYLAMEQTRSVNSVVQVRAGMHLVSNRRRPMLLLAEDTSPGVHDTLLCACNAAIYRELGCAPDHRSCEQNLHEALAAIGAAAPLTPAPFNIFMHVVVMADGGIDRRPPLARPGDRVRLLAEMDVIAAFSACPQDVTPINGPARAPTDIMLRHLVPT